MKNLIFIINACICLLILSCGEEVNKPELVEKNYKLQLLEIQKSFISAAKEQNVKKLVPYYSKDVIYMQEYQPTLRGVEGIETYCKNLFKRQKIKEYQRDIDEVIDLDSKIIEIGTFIKEYTDLVDIKEYKLRGKYWNIWELQDDNSLLLSAEGFGYFHHVDNPESLILDSLDTQRLKAKTIHSEEVPVELKAYSALSERGVRNRDGILRSQMYTDDVKYMPFADSIKTGMAELKSHLIEYNKGQVTIDSIAVYTFDYENLNDHILEYYRFEVTWTIPNFTGYTEGKGIRIWKRQEDCSLRIHRAIGLHNHLE